MSSLADTKRSIGLVRARPRKNGMTLKQEIGRLLFPHLPFNRRSLDILRFEVGMLFRRSLNTVNPSHLFRLGISPAVPRYRSIWEVEVRASRMGERRFQTAW